MRYKRPDWILAAFYRKAFLLERLAQTIYEAPVPPEFKKKGAEEYLAAYQDALAAGGAAVRGPGGRRLRPGHRGGPQAPREERVDEEDRRVARALPAAGVPDPEGGEARASLAEDLSPSPFADTLEGPSRRPLPGESRRPRRPRREAAAAARRPAASADARRSTRPRPDPDRDPDLDPDLDPDPASDRGAKAPAAAEPARHTPPPKERTR